MTRSIGVETRARILNTAITLFAERGTSGTGMRELAEATDLTLPGLYYHFKSKQDLVKAIFEERGARVRNRRSPKSETTVAQRIKGQALADFEDMKDDFMRLLVLEAITRDNDAAAGLQEARTDWDARWAKTLAGASDLAPGVDVAAAARSLTTALMGIYLMYLTGQESTIKGRIDELARVISNSLTNS